MSHYFYPTSVKPKRVEYKPFGSSRRFSRETLTSIRRDKKHGPTPPHFSRHLRSVPLFPAFLPSALPREWKGRRKLKPRETGFSPQPSRFDGVTIKPGPPCTIFIIRSQVSETLAPTRTSEHLSRVHLLALSCEHLLQSADVACKLLL